VTTIGEYFDGILIRGINEGVGRDDIVQSFHGTPADGAFELPVGPPGDPGPPGPTAYPFRHEGDIADMAALNALATTLRPAHAGKAWRVVSTNRLMIWNGSAFDGYPDAFGGHGPDGEPNTLSIGTVTTGAVGADVEITVTGVPPAQTVNLVVPRGVKGLKGKIGGPGPIRQASDYDNSVSHLDGMVPLWNAATAKWKPSAYPGWRGPWTVIETQAWDGSAGFATSQPNIATSPNTIATLTIPAQDTAWRPFVTGGALVRTVVTDSSTRVDLEVRLGSDSGQIVAFGPGTGYGIDTYTTLLPHFATLAMTPASSVGVVAAGAAATLVLVLRRNVGSGNYYYTRTGAHLAVWAVPVTGAP
jgi:hypothetical protein